MRKENALENVTFVIFGRRPGKGELRFTVTQEIYVCYAEVCGCVHMGRAAEEKLKNMFANHCRG